MSSVTSIILRLFEDCEQQPGVRLHYRRKTRIMRLTSKQFECYRRVCEFINTAYIETPLLIVRGGVGVGKRTVVEKSILDTSMVKQYTFVETANDMYPILFNGGKRIGQDNVRIFVMRNPSSSDFRYFKEKLNGFFTSKTNMFRLILILNSESYKRFQSSKISRALTMSVTLWQSTIRDMLRIAREVFPKQHLRYSSIATFDGDIRNKLKQLQFNLIKPSSILGKDEAPALTRTGDNRNDANIAYSSATGCLGNRFEMGVSDSVVSLLRENMLRVFTLDLKHTCHIMDSISSIEHIRPTKYNESIVWYTNYVVSDQNRMSGIHYCSKCNTPLRMIVSSKKRKRYIVCQCEAKFYSANTSEELRMAPASKRGPCMSYVSCLLCGFKAYSRKCVLSHECKTGTTEISKCFGKERLKRFFTSSKQVCINQRHNMAAERVYRPNDYLLNGYVDLKKKRLETLSAIQTKQGLKSTCSDYIGNMHRLSLHSLKYIRGDNSYNALSSEQRRILKIGVMKHKITNISASGILAISATNL